jgi:hypothetical protein
MVESVHPVHDPDRDRSHGVGLVQRTHRIDGRWLPCARYGHHAHITAG